MNIIYNRTSTEEQNPENQLKDCLTINNNEEYILIEDQETAWKEEVKREGFERLIRLIKERKTKKLIVWDLDRLYRNRKRLVAFMELCKNYNCIVLSYNQKWLDELNNIPSPWNEIMFNLMIQVMGWLAEDESNKKSKRVKIATRKICPKCEKTNMGNSEKCINCNYDLRKVKKISYKGNKWGRKKLNKKTIEWVLKLEKEGKTYDEIIKEVFYWNKNNNKKFISKGMVSKIINKYKK